MLDPPESRDETPARIGHGHGRRMNRLDDGAPCDLDCRDILAKGGGNHLTGDGPLAITTGLRRVRHDGRCYRRRDSGVKARNLDTLRGGIVRFVGS